MTSTITVRWDFLALHEIVLFFIVPEFIVGYFVCRFHKFTQIDLAWSSIHDFDLIFTCFHLSLF